jgi:hypothetical protein
MATPIGEILQRRGLITAEELGRALAIQRRTPGTRLGVCLLRMGIVDEEALAEALGEQLGVPVVPSSALDDLPPEVIERIPAEMARSFAIVPLRVLGREIHLALADPQNLGRLDEISFALGCRIRAFLATEPAIERALAQYYAPEDPWQEAMKAGPGLEAVDAVYVADPTGVDLVPEAAPEPEERPGPVGEEDPYHRLASVLSDDDLVATMSAFFARLFTSYCLLEMVPGGARIVGLRRMGDSRPRPRPTAPMRIDDAVWLRDLQAHPQVDFLPQASDVHLRALLEASGLGCRLVAVVPIFNLRQLRFVLLAQGVAVDQLEPVFGELKPYLVAVSQALRMMALRDLIRQRARG